MLAIQPTHDIATDPINFQCRKMVIFALEEEFPKPLLIIQTNSRSLIQAMVESPLASLKARRREA